MKFTLNCQQAKEHCLARISAIDFSKKPIQVVTIENFKKERTTAQNRYYFGVVVPMMADCYGDSKEEFHAYLKEKFLMPKKVTINGFTFDVRPSTKDLSTVDFNAYIELCCQHAAQDMQLYIPPPNEPLH